MRLAEGQWIDGRYKLDRRVGSGGMAEVWLAFDAELERHVALKFLYERFAADEQFVERFRREASAAAGLMHPNVVGVFDRGEHGGSHYIAMEYVEGRSLKEAISDGLSVAESLAIVRQILLGVRFAHSRGIVHRDVKPGNVMIDGDDHVRVTDFGIARAGGTDITQTGSVLGTAQYLSPEQAQGQAVGPATDLYSIGVILFESLTGSVPFDGDSAVAVALKQVSERPVAPSTLNPQVPPALDAVVLKALEKEPHARYTSAQEFLDDLDRAEADPHAVSGNTATYAAVQPPPATEPAERRRSRWPWVVAALALLAIAAGAFALTRAQDVEVPNVIGRDVGVATQMLEGRGFDVDAREVASQQASGTVLEQDPIPGSTAREGSEVTLSVSGGPGVAAIPDVTGMPQRRATRELRDAGFRVRTEARTAGDVDEGRVISTRPPSGTRVERGSVVVVIVSGGPEVVAVPSVVGQDRGTAETTLRDAGFVVSVDRTDSDAPVDQVIDQVPLPGSSVERGERVTIIVSSGAGSVVVPDVTGQAERAAVRNLERRGLSVTVVEQEVDARREDGRVLDQAPGSGARVRTGDRVTIFVGAFAEPEPEPDTQDE